ncbi:RdgB/HAM1 family non-canonical purine NTP pyrophosphatase [Shewanella sp. SNU WT4]|uniref:RdgB/HAM1 family non-canonical purine NTP pyrophosphatase n=1 Tax=Shewanella sp. SNU WT4 TaxID=2590015 RepID=UPI00112B12E8|nr:RdgB/HAM1 family non-canonical purine NTP pyrophosphatase [Shewanella sp. SNU WT4]QDF67847.1 RdgB/HAM1 family non-canonical purine NTP pyrophosphatase [Shewanella sp. SNU WT4]
MKHIVLASGNKGKLAEFEQMLAPFGVNMLPQSQFEVTEVAETGTTFVENAIIKARHAAQITGHAAIADDSGLEVDVLDGAPGIYSARFAGENATDADNVTKLLATLENHSQPSACFQCVLVYMRHHKDPTPIICQASWEGVISNQRLGDNGHGYDPVFIPAETAGQSAAQISSDDKNRLSHRGKALQMLIAAMQEKGVL